MLTSIAKQLSESLPTVGLRVIETQGAYHSTETKSNEEQQRGQDETTTLHTFCLARLLINGVIALSVCFTKQPPPPCCSLQ